MKTIMPIYILFIDATTVVALIVTALIDSEVSAWILIGVFVAHSISYHIVSICLLRLISRIKACRIPIPHGRLIDADALIKEAHLMWDDPLEAYESEACVPVSVIKNAPTIVKREEEDK